MALVSLELETLEVLVLPVLLLFVGIVAIVLAEEEEEKDDSVIIKARRWWLDAKNFCKDTFEISRLGGIMGYLMEYSKLE